MKKHEILEKIVGNAFEISVNLSDTFFYACADSETISGSDYLELVPLIEKYGFSAEVAYCALKRGYDPKVARSLDSNFYKAKDEIIEIIKKSEFYGAFYDLKEYREIDNQEQLSEKILGFFKSKTHYSSIQDLLTMENLSIGSSIELKDRGYEVKITGIGENSVILKTTKIFHKAVNNEPEFLYSLAKMNRLIQILKGE